MPSIKIDKGMPIPPPPHKKYPFDLMEVGDSFFVPAGEDIERTHNNLRCSALAFGLRRQQRFTTRREDGGVRVWRTE
jgi:hypothetical protein